MESRETSRKRLNDSQFQIHEQYIAVRISNTNIPPFPVYRMFARILQHRKHLFPVGDDDKGGSFRENFVLDRTVYQMPEIGSRNYAKVNTSCKS